MSLRLYTGEFLVSPVPLHIDMNWCSHNCFYCFANLNQPQRRFDGAWMRALAKGMAKPASDDEPLERWLLRRGHPVLVSNTVDPFARSNAEQFLGMHDLLSGLGVRMTYQTKGGDEACLERALSDAPTLFYVSLTTDDEARRRQIEPGAPPHEARMELIREAKRRGHHVVAGFNPLVPDWWRDIDATIGELVEAGVDHAWLGVLHLSRFHVAAMPERTRACHAAEVSYALKKDKPDWSAIHGIEARMGQAGINTFADKIGAANGFWDAYFATTGAPFWPTLDGWFRHLDRVSDGRIVLFSQREFADWCDVGLPAGRSLYKEYVQPFARSIRNRIGDGEAWREIHEKPRSMAAVIAAYWQVFDYPTPLRSERIATPCEGEGDDFTIFEDDDGNDLLAYVPEGVGAAFVQVSADTAVRYSNLQRERG